MGWLIGIGLISACYAWVAMGYAIDGALKRRRALRGHKRYPMIQPKQGGGHWSVGCDHTGGDGCGCKAELPRARALPGKRGPVGPLEQCFDTCYGCGAPVRMGYSCSACGEYRRSDPPPAADAPLRDFVERHVRNDTPYAGAIQTGAIGHCPRTISTEGDPFSIPQVPPRTVLK